MKKAITVPQEVAGGRVCYWQHTDGEQRGPSTWPEYKQAHSAGETNAELLVYCADVADEWKAAQEVPNLMAYVEAPEAGPQAAGSAAGAAHARRALCKRAGTGAGAFQRVRGPGRRPDSMRGRGAGASARAGARVCRGPLRSLRSDRQHAGARRGLGARAPGAGRGPVRPRCPVPSTPSRRVDGVWATNTPSHVHYAGRRRRSSSSRSAGPGDGEAGTFKIDIAGCRLRQLQVRQAQGRSYWAGPQVPALLDRGGGEMS